jgi:hypothetical protein
MGASSNGLDNSKRNMTSAFSKNIIMHSSFLFLITRLQERLGSEAVRPDEFVRKVAHIVAQPIFLSQLTGAVEKN